MSLLKQLRAQLAGMAARVSPSSERFGAPHGICRSVSGWCREHGARYADLSGAEFCGSAGKQTGSDPAAQLFVAELPDARVFGEHCLTVLSPQDEVFAELTTAWRPPELEATERIEEHRVFRKFLWPRIHELKGRAAVLAVPGGETYYHWLLEVLPRLELIRQAKIELDSIDHFIVNSRQCAFQQATLRHLGIEARCVALDKHPHVKARSLVAPSFVGIYGKPAPWILAFLRCAFLPAAKFLEKPRPRRIYISRSRAQTRHIDNEADLIKLLARFRFIAVWLEELSFAEQVALFAQAEAIIGPHGSGFTNLVFCSPQTKVIEIFPPQTMPVMYEHLSRGLELDYHRFVAQAGVIGGRTRDVTVRLGELEALLTDWLAARG